MKTDAGDGTSREHPPDLVLELLFSGEGAGRITETWGAHAAGCTRCTTRLAELAEHTSGYRASPEARGLRDLLMRTEQAGARAGRRTFAGRLWWLGLPAATAAGLIGIILVLRTPEPDGDLRVKGQGRFSAVVRRGGETSGWDGGPLRSGDEVQLAWAGPTAGFLVVMAREAGGEALVLFPEHGEIAGAVLAGQARPVGASLKITSASRPFAATACFSTAPMRVVVLRESARRDAGAAGACAGEMRALSFAVDPL